MPRNASTSDQNCSDGELLNEYEQRRADRIARNKQVLMEMGIISSLDALAAASKKGACAQHRQHKLPQKRQGPSRRSERLRTPSRMSLRIQGQEPKEQPVLGLKHRCAEVSKSLKICYMV